MFKNLIYFDSNKVAEYTAVLEGQRKVKLKKAKFKTDRTFRADINLLSAGKGGGSLKVSYKRI